LADWVQAKLDEGAGTPPAEGASASDSSTEKLKCEIREKLSVLDGLILSLGAAALLDGEVAKVLQRKEAERAHLREQLRNLKPLSLQLQLAVADRDKAERKVNGLKEERRQLEVLLSTKDKEIEEASCIASVHAAEVTRLMGLQGVASTSPVSLGLSNADPSASPARFAAAFAASLPAQAAASFAAWLQSQPALPVAPAAGWDPYVQPAAVKVECADASALAHHSPCVEEAVDVDLTDVGEEEGEEELVPGSAADLASKLASAFVAMNGGAPQLDPAASAAAAARSQGLAPFRPVRRQPSSARVSPMEGTRSEVAQPVEPAAAEGSAAEPVVPPSSSSP
jgi:hypothetical protein